MKQRHLLSFARQRSGRGVTLVELMVSVAIISILSTAVFAMLSGALNLDRYMRNSVNTTSAMELAIRRILHNVRTASALTTPTNGTATSTLTTITQPDPNHSNATYTVTYTLSGGQLTETDTRYGTNVLLKNVTAFTVTLVNTTTPVMAQVTISATVIDSTVQKAQAAQVTRSFNATFRNL